MQRVAIVTGGSRGIGLATARLFIGMGWQVIALDRTPPNEALDGLSFHELDVSEHDAVEGFFDDLDPQIDGLHALVNNAAVQVCKSILETSIQEWDQVLDTNLRSVFLMAKYSYAHLKQVQGSIVNVSSVHSIHTSQDIGAYAASKGGLTAFTRAMALEFAEDGVRVNSVLPGAVDTDMLRAGLNRDHLKGSMEQRLKELAGRHPLARIGKPEDIASAIYFLADPGQSGFITGHSLVVDGGAVARLSTE